MSKSLLVTVLIVALAFSYAEDEWWKGGVFYQIYPRSWMDSDGNGEGDIVGITNRLEHLKELGVTGFWLNPVFKSPFKDGGYDIADYYDIHERFGTLEQIQTLFDKAKELGLRILFDLVPNHTSDEHMWFKESAKRNAPYEDFYVWKDCTVDENDNVIEYPNNWIAVFHTRAWTYNKERGQCYLHQFLAAQPDLNYRNESVNEEFKKILTFWLDKGVDGFRIDAINHMFEVPDFADEALISPDADPTFYDNLYHNHTMNLDETYDVVRGWRKLMDDYAIEKGTDKKFMMTEAYASIEQQKRWYGTSDEPISHMPFNFQLIMQLNRSSNALEFKNAVDSWYTDLPSFAEANWVLGNHDRARIGYRYGDERHESLAVFTMLLPGINVVYYGEEILMTDNRAITWEETDDPQACQTNETVYQQHTRDPVRTPFQWDDTRNAGFSTSTNGTWLPIHANYTERNLKKQKEAERSTFKLYQELIKLKKENIFKYGSFRSSAVSNQIFGFMRSYQQENNVVVFINLGYKTIVNIRSLLLTAEIPAQPRGRILVATSMSPYKKNDLVDPTRIEIEMYDAIALVVESGSLDETTQAPTPSTPPTTTTGGAITLISSIILIMISVVISLY